MLLEQVLAMIRRYCENVPSCSAKIIKSNMESVWIRGEGGGDDVRKACGVEAQLAVSKTINVFHRRSRATPAKRPGGVRCAGCGG